MQASFDHGEEGYGLWLDPAIADDPVYTEHWAGHRQVEVTVEPDRIVIKRTGDDRRRRQRTRLATRTRPQDSTTTEPPLGVRGALAQLRRRAPAPARGGRGA